MNEKKFLIDLSKLTDGEKIEMKKLGIYLMIINYRICFSGCS